MNKLGLTTICLLVSILLTGCFGSSSSTKSETCPVYAPSLAYLMAQVSSAAYESDSNKLNDILSDLGLTLDDVRIKDSNTGTQGFLAYNNDLVVVAFRGTEDFKDWISNVQVWENKMNKTPNCDQSVRVHEGFHDAVKSVVKDGQLFSRIAELQQTGRKFYITGHSLGGALSTLMAYFSAEKEAINIDGVYTYGQPPIGDSEFRQCYEAQLLDKTFRFVNHKDVVPRLKPNDSLKHVGLLLFLDNDGNLLTEEPKGLLNTTKNVLDNALIKSHSIDAYISDLEKHRNNNPFACE
ncbi:MAG: lipase family protein [Methylococcales bacterium]